MSRKPDPVAVLVGTDAELAADHLRGLDARFTEVVGAAVAERKVALEIVESRLRAAVSSWPDRVTRLEAEVPILLERVRSADEGGRVARRQAADEQQRRLSLEASLRDAHVALAVAKAETAAMLARAEASERVAGTAEARATEAERSATELRRKVTQLETEGTAILAECRRLRERPGGPLPGGRLKNVTGNLAEIAGSAVVVGAAAVKPEGEEEPNTGVYLVGDWVFFLNDDDDPHQDDETGRTFVPRLTLAEADRFAGENEVRWLETDLEATLESGGTAAEWLQHVQGFTVVDKQPVQGRFWFYDRAGGKIGQKTPKIQSAALELRACGFRVDSVTKPTKGFGYYFKEGSKSPTAMDRPG
jgi:hypothetical protein